MNPAETARTLPLRPGVYLFHDAAGIVMYVGKANKLRQRVASYFQKSISLAPAKRIMIDEIKRIEHIVVNSETEALLLESTLIKKHRPKYNIILKDDKYFQYIKVTLRDPFPQVLTVRRIVLDGSRYFGPYTSGLSVRQTLRMLKKLFPYKSCKNNPARPCFDYQLGRCLGHDTGPGSQETYRQIIKRFMEFLDGHTGQVLIDLRRQMKDASRSHDFEQAALLRDRLQALEHVLEKQTVVTSRRESFDVLALARMDSLAAVNLFQVRQGKLVQKDQFMMQHTKDQTEAEILGAFIEQFYSQSTNHPPTVYTRYRLDPRAGQPLQLHVAQVERGLKRKLVKLGEENAADYLKRDHDRWLNEQERAEQGLQQLSAALDLPTTPKRIEMYDISNFQGSFSVGSMVVFINGLASKSQYRKFRIKTVSGPDDVHMMAEVLRRRFQNKHSIDWPWPDLLLLDGGKAQLNTVRAEVGELPSDMPMAALAKREEELFVPGRSKSIRLPAGSQGLFLVQRIRDEAHRFAIGYYRKRHSAESTRSILDQIPGLGPETKKLLLRHFGSVEAVRRADSDELADVVGPTKAALIHEHIAYD